MQENIASSRSQYEKLLARIGNWEWLYCDWSRGIQWNIAWALLSSQYSYSLDRGQPDRGKVWTLVFNKCVIKMPDPVLRGLRWTTEQKIRIMEYFYTVKNKLLSLHSNSRMLSRVSGQSVSVDCLRLNRYILQPVFWLIKKFRKSSKCCLFRIVLKKCYNFKGKTFHQHTILWSKKFQFHLILAWNGMEYKNKSQVNLNLDISKVLIYLFM